MAAPVMRLLVRALRCRRHARTRCLLRPLELALGYGEPDPVEHFPDPYLTSVPAGRHAQRERKVLCAAWLLWAEARGGDYAMIARKHAQSDG